MPAAKTADKDALLEVRELPLPMRVLLAVLAILLGIVAGAAAIPNSVGRLAPQAMADWWPANGWIMADAGNAVFLGAITENKGQIPPDFPRAMRDLSVQALRHEPMAVPAIRDLAYYYQSEDGQPRTRRLMTIADTLSRRDAATHMWLMTDFANRGDQARALDNYDIILRTSTQAPAVLLPAMAELLQRPGTVDPFYALLRREPPWQEDFWSAVIQSRDALDNAYLLRSKLLRAGVDLNIRHDSMLIAQLVSEGKIDEAAKLDEIAGERLGRKRVGLLANADFSARPELAPFDWKLVESDDFGAEIDARAGTLRVTALSGASGVFAQQLTTLVGGRYRLEIDPVGSATAMPALRVELACAEQLGRKTLDWSATVIPGTPREFRLDTSCRHAWFSLGLDGSDSAGSRDFAISRVFLQALTSRENARSKQVST